MYVCVCKAVTERQVKQAVNEGVDTMRDLNHRLGVAGECGRCAKCALACLREHRASQEQVRQDSMFDLIPEAA